MYTPERAWHWVRPNEINRMPRRHIILDSEARQSRAAGGFEQHWRLACATFRSQEKGRPLQRRTDTFTDPETLWQAVNDFTSKRGRTVLWAHNLGYDVRITDALTALPAMGWRLDGHNLAPRGTWLTWRREDRSLTMVDTAAIWPTTLGEIAHWFGMAKTPLPAEGAPDSEWREHCLRDVEITETAVVAYLGWLESEGMGNWQLTGAGQSWAAFRHNWLTHRMLVHADRDALEAERAAMWTGRCEAYWRGRITHGKVHEWDLEAAYARVARRVNVPTRLIGQVGVTHPWRKSLADPELAVLAEVTVTTDLPTVPTRVDGRIAWPVGTFTTTLWSPELALLAETDAKVSVHRAWLYRAEPALRAWAQWILDRLARTDDDVPPWQRKILKHWSRALIGRFAMSYTQWEELGQLETPAMWRAQTEDDVDGTEYQTMALGRQVFRSVGTVEWDQSMPQVTGYVMAACRAQLWRIMAALPADCPLYVDTDSILCQGSWYGVVADVAASEVGDGLRLKQEWDSAEILGPRQLVTGPKTRISGVKHGAQRVARDLWAGQVWESAEQAVAQRRPDRVMVTDRAWRVAGLDRRRLAGLEGWTDPLVVGR